MKTPSTRLVRQAIFDAGVLEEGHFVFAAGNHATIKIEMDNLWHNPASLRTVIAALAAADGLPAADAILGVPIGGQRLAEATAELTGLPIIRLERVPGGAKQDFRFASEDDARLARHSRAPRIYEDVVTTLSSVAGAVKLLDPKAQNIQVLTIWRRARVNPDYRRGLTDHYLIEEEFPSYPPDQCPVCQTAKH